MKTQHQHTARPLQNSKLLPHFQDSSLGIYKSKLPSLTLSMSCILKFIKVYGLLCIPIPFCNGLTAVKRSNLFVRFVFKTLVLSDICVKKIHHPLNSFIHTNIFASCERIVFGTFGSLEKFFCRRLEAIVTLTKFSCRPLEAIVTLTIFSCRPLEAIVRLTIFSCRLLEAIVRLTIFSCRRLEAIVTLTKPSCRLFGHFVTLTEPSCRLFGHFVTLTKPSCRLFGHFVTLTKPSCRQFAHFVAKKHTYRREIAYLFN